MITFAATLLARLQLRALSWWHSTSLPHEPDVWPLFQPWFIFDPSVDDWIELNPSSPPAADHDGGSAPFSDSLSIVTWNVCGTSARPEDRIEALLASLRSTAAWNPDFILLQEVSRQALSALLRLSWIRETYTTSDVDARSWGGQRYASVSLVARSRRHSLGRLWKLPYPSRYRREALCCDVLLPSPNARFSSPPLRLRLINVHLDSLPLNPSKRPRQIAICASYLRAAGGKGFIAGDFNPVLPEDADLVGANGLTDAWEELRPGEGGFTWGIDGKAPFPPTRLDKVATMGLRPVKINIITCEALERVEGVADVDPGTKERRPLAWSDHAGLRLRFEVSA